MKRIAYALPLLAGIPSVAFAQVTLSFPRMQRPLIRATLGPVQVVASLSTRGVNVHSPRSESKPRATSATAARILATAELYLGTRYRYGGASPREGFDCSGFVQYVFAKHGIELPRTSRQQAHAGDPLPLSTAALRPGDLLLFASGGSRVNHVALYVGNNRMLHASAGAGRVVYDDLTTPRGHWYLQRHVASRRLL
jgi:cell wall-associated NlpC family hydrolase